MIKIEGFGAEQKRPEVLDAFLLFVKASTKRTQQNFNFVALERRDNPVCPLPGVFVIVQDTPSKVKVPQGVISFFVALGALCVSY